MTLEEQLEQWEKLAAAYKTLGGELADACALIRHLTRKPTPLITATSVSEIKPSTCPACGDKDEIHKTNSIPEDRANDRTRWECSACHCVWTVKQQPGYWRAYAGL